MENVLSLHMELALAGRLVAAALLGGIIGIEREIMNRTAGLRTHVMVSVGAALFTVLSIYFFSYENGPRDPARIAAQIVSGIGFLGAGAIMKHGATVHGLTTAATLWVVAAIGMACGAGAYMVSVSACVVSLITLVTLRRLEPVFTGSNVIYLNVVMPNDPGILERMRRQLNDGGIKIRKMTISQEDQELLIETSLTMENSVTKADVITRLTELGATKISLET
ncbi:MAG: MgtC/SapB family protein [Candidatus Bruticola sp.]